jgi:site-specific DNA-methyltransferase (adenine-specific)
VTPYWTSHDGRHVLYHGDCLEVMPSLPKVDAVVTDPPYGIAYSPGPGGRGWTSGRKNFSGTDIVAGDNKPFNPAPLLAFPQLILWGGNHYASRLPDSPTWLIWHKRRPGEAPNDFADCELAWSNMGGPARVFCHEWKGAMRESERAEHYHPTQKPVALMQWCLSFTPPGCLILDPYSGAGPVGIACVRTGRRSIGIELEERYCEIAVRRMEAELAQPMLIPPAAPENDQPPLFTP